MTRGQALASLGSAVLAAAAPPSPLPVPSPVPSTGPSLAVYHVRADAAADGAITPDRLLTFKGVRIEVVTDASRIAAASSAVDAAAAEAREGSILDARWGLRFATATERVVHSVFCDALGGAGQVDGHPVTFTNGTALIAYLDANFGPA